MNILRTGIAILVALTGCSTTAPPVLAVDPVPAAAPSISAERMSEITRVLASDEFQGRSMGGPGEEKSVAYLIDQFKAAGLEPGGENGGWTQTVPMIRTQLQAPMSFLGEPAGPDARRCKFPDDIYVSTVRAGRAGAGSPTRRWSSSATA